MGRDGVAVDARVVGLVARMAGGEKLNVRAEALLAGISRKQLYHYRKRYRAEGLDGFVVQSRRPRSSPNQSAVHVEEAVVAIRKLLQDDGSDHGATSIGYWLMDHPELLVDADGVIAVLPSRATINRILDRRGQLRVQPQRRPRKASRRFRRDSANDLWQMDGHEYVLADDTIAVILDVLDDHSRMLLASHAARSENATDAWIATQKAVDCAGGLPRQMLTDNGNAFNGHRRGFTTALELALARLGVEPISSRTRHPQTCGKVERHHATGQQWLRARPPAADLAALQGLLEDYRERYNQRRRHQALGGVTPARAWADAHREGRVSGPGGAPALLLRTNPTVGPRGCIGVDDTEISIGRAHIGAVVVVFRTDDRVVVFVDGRYDHERDLDRTRRYQPQHRRKVSPMS